MVYTDHGLTSITILFSLNCNLHHHHISTKLQQSMVLNQNNESTTKLIYSPRFTPACMSLDCTTVFTPWLTSITIFPLNCNSLQFITKTMNQKLGYQVYPSLHYSFYNIEQLTPWYDINHHTCMSTKLQQPTVFIPKNESEIWLFYPLRFTPACNYSFYTIERFTPWYDINHPMVTKLQQSTVFNQTKESKTWLFYPLKFSPLSL